MSFEIEENLKKSGVMSIRHYYKNDPILGNIFTACVFFSEDRKILARGVSICSVKDSHSKKFGREKSKSRAITALFKKVNSLPIMPLDMEKELNAPSKRAFEYHIKSFKLNKNDPEFNAKKEKLLEDISKHAAITDFVVQTFDNFEKTSVYIPYTLPMEEASITFKYKSEYNPEPTEEEKVMFKL